MFLNRKDHTNTLVKKVLLVIGIALMVISGLFFILFIVGWIQGGFGEALIGLIFAVLILLAGVTVAAKSMDMPVKYRRDPIIESVRFMKFRFGKIDNPADYTEPVYPVEPRFSKYDGTYSFFVDSCLMTMDGCFREVIGLFDERQYPIPLDNFNFSFEAADSGECGFVVASRR